MRVSENGRLLRDDGTPVPFRESPNRGGPLIEPTAIVVHFTAGRSFQQSVEWLCNPKAKASALCVIGRENEITQLVSANRVAWHAGESSWRGRPRVNDWAYGIELENFGQLTEYGGRAYPWFEFVRKNGKPALPLRLVEGAEPVAECDVFRADDGTVWHAYTNDQILLAYEVSEALIDHAPKIDTVLGHRDVRKSKSDPGPAFPMEQFRSWLLTRGEG